MKKKLSLVLCICLCLSLFVGCGNSNKDELGGANKNAEKVEQAGSRELVFGNQTTIQSLDPHTEWNGWGEIRTGMGETLFRLNNDLQVEPWIAEGFENIDPLTWKIKLKENVTFSNGEKVTAEKVVESLKRTGQMNERANILADAKYTTEGEYKIIVKTNEPVAAFINTLCDPNTIIADVSGTSDFENAPVLTGPYKISEFEPKKLVVVVPNENYWNGEPQLDKITEKYIQDPSTMSMALQSGEIDVAVNITSDVTEVFKGNEEYKVEQLPTSRVFMVYFNPQNVPDVELRKAIAYGVDKKTIADDLLQGTLTPAKGPFPIGLEYGGADLDVPEYDIEKAKEILENAGYVDVNGDGIREKDGKPFTLNLMFYKRLALEQVATELQAQLTELGLDVNAQLGETYEYLKGDEYDLGMYGCVTAAIGDSYDFLEKTWGSEGTSNFNHFKSDKVEELLKEMKEEYDSKKRSEIAVQIQQEALNYYTNLFVGHVNVNIVSNSKVKDLRITPLEYVLIDEHTTIE